MKNFLKTWLLLVLLSAVTGLNAQKQEFESLRDAIFSAGQLRGENGPANIVWISNGAKYSFTKMNERNQEIWIHDVKTGEETMVFTTKDKTFSNDKPFRYRSFQWAGDYKFLLFQTNFEPIWRYSGNADYYYYSIDNKTLDLIVEQAFTAEVSPDGTKLGYGKDGNLFAYTFDGNQTVQFTDDAEDHFYNGRWGWAYEEEFGLVQAWKWSTDSKYIAFWQSDERHVPIYQLSDQSGMHPEYMDVPYPKVGDPAPYVKIGIINTTSSETTWIDYDLKGGYIPRIYWTANENELAIVYMNRPQNFLDVSLVNVLSGDKKSIYKEEAVTWIDIYDFFAGELDHFHFPGNTDEFYFVSERDGWAHIYAINYNSGDVRQITSGEWEVVGIKAIDPKKKMLYYVSTEISPLEHHLYSIKLNGKSKHQITTAEGNHNINLSPDGKYYFDTYSSVSEPSITIFSSTSGKENKQLTENSGVKEYIKGHVYTPKELFSFVASDGKKRDGYLMKPVNFDPEKSYPLVLDIYGGPGSQGVYNTFGTNGWHQWLCQLGFVVASVNNRGNGGYGSDFEKIVHKQLGKMESQDFVETAQYLAEKSWIDGNRMAIRGHSYGGFMSSYTMVNHPGVFKASIVAAPNADHRLYDCILTERLMGLIEDNEEGYINSAVATNADKLEGEMLLVHSLMDENVHPQHTFQLVNAFIQAGKDIDLKIYPPGDHGVAYDLTSYLLLMNQYTDFLIEHLMSE